MAEQRLYVFLVRYRLDILSPMDVAKQRKVIAVFERTGVIQLPPLSTLLYLLLPYRHVGES